MAPGGWVCRARRLLAGVSELGDAARLTGQQVSESAPTSGAFSFPTSTAQEAPGAAICRGVATAASCSARCAVAVEMPASRRTAALEFFPAPGRICILGRPAAFCGFELPTAGKFFASAAPSSA